jgi:hypothetical protein
MLKMLMTAGVTKLSATLVSPNPDSASHVHHFQLSTSDWLLLPISPVSLDNVYSYILAGFNYIFFLAMYPHPFTQNTETILILSFPLFSSLTLTLFLLHPNICYSSSQEKQNICFNITIQIKELLLKRNKI